MFTLLALFGVIGLGYLLFAPRLERTFGAGTTGASPAMAHGDGVDYVPMGKMQAFLIQFLNIAGLGPIYGAVAGALWGPVAFLWITLGCILVGGVHDYCAGLLSYRNGGLSIPEAVGRYLGPAVRDLMRVYAAVLLLLVGTVFLIGAAKLLSTFEAVPLSFDLWLGLIIIYFILATLLPVDAVIGRLYPFFGAVLLLMAGCIVAALFFEGYQVPAVTLENLHPDGLPVWPLLFVTIACGAVSGFHATQSPLMARCVTSEAECRTIFFGSMAAEGILALVWAAAALAFFGSTAGLGEALDAGGPGGVVTVISSGLLGPLGSVLAVIAVAICPITSGDTAFRGARLVLADSLGIPQERLRDRVLLAAPFFAAALLLSRIDFTFIWRYFAWANQTFAMVVLWAAAVYLAGEGRRHWTVTLPACLMTAVSVTYILVAPEGLSLSYNFAVPAGAVAAVAALLVFLRATRRKDSGTQVRPEPMAP